MHQYSNFDRYKKSGSKQPLLMKMAEVAAPLYPQNLSTYCSLSIIYEIKEVKGGRHTTVLHIFYVTIDTESNGINGNL